MSLFFRDLEMHLGCGTPDPADPPPRRPEALVILAIGLACVSALLAAHYLLGL